MKLLKEHSLGNRTSLKLQDDARDVSVAGICLSTETDELLIADHANKKIKRFTQVDKTISTMMVCQGKPHGIHLSTNRQFLFTVEENAENGSEPGRPSSSISY